MNHHFVTTTPPVLDGTDDERRVCTRCGHEFTGPHDGIRERCRPARPTDPTGG